MEQQRQEPAEPGVTPEHLERERLRTYIDWADVRAPAWYWPAYAGAIALWLAGYEFGLLWGTVGVLLVVAVTVVGLRVMAARGQVFMPRFRGMPAPLKRAYLPAGAAAAWLVGVLAYGAFADAGPFVLLGVVTGPLMALAGAWTSRRYRIEAQRLAVREDLER